MKVRVEFTVEIDEEAWREDYRIADVRDDVKRMLEDAADAWLAERQLGKVL